MFILPCDFSHVGRCSTTKGEPRAIWGKKIKRQEHEAHLDDLKVLDPLHHQRNTTLDCTSFNLLQLSLALAEIQNGDRALQRFVARDSPAGHAAICAAVPTHVTTRLAFTFSFLFSSPVFQQLLFIFPDLNFLLSTIYFSREILLTKTLEKKSNTNYIKHCV